MRIIRYTVVALLLLVTTGMGVILLAPAVLVRPVLGFYLGASGFELTALEGLNVGAQQASVSRIALRNDTLLVTVSGTELSYSLSGLSAGELTAITITTLDVELLPEPVAEAASGASVPIADQARTALQILGSLPLANLRIDAIDVHSADTTLDLDLQISTQPLLISGSIASSQYADYVLRLDATPGDSGTVTGQASILHNMQTVMETDLTATVAADNLHLTAMATLDLRLLPQLAGSIPALATLASSTGTLTLVAQLEAHGTGDAVALTAIDLVLDSPESALQISQQTEPGQIDVLLQLPLHLTGSMPALDEPWQLAADSLQATISVAQDAIQLQSEIALANTRIDCTLVLVCTGAGAFDIGIAEFGSAGMAARDTRAQGRFALDYSADGLDIALPATELALPALRLATTEINTTLLLSDLRAHIDSQTSAQTSASLNFSSQHLDPGLAGIQLRDPSITGNISYADNGLHLDLNLALANQLQAAVSADYGILTQTGRLEWTIPAYYFSAITPASALVTQSIIEMDIVSGSVAGNGALAIGQDAAGNWQLAGPVTLALDELSGFVADTVFVGFNSTIQAALSDQGQLRTEDLLSASIATLDVGLPLTDIRWNYRFDSATQTILIQNLLMHTLGGEITMAEFNYAIQDPDSQLTVVVTNLNLQSIVDLAQYPGIRVEGLISGYLPLTLKGQQLTVEKGLIGALQPGGTIRYTANSPANTGNASLDLVNQALANYHYQIMNTYVYYNEDGDLRLEVQLLGNNPDLYNGQMVNLNVNIDDNIPTLLRSLQASRTITDALEQRLQNRRTGGNPGF